MDKFDIEINIKVKTQVKESYQTPDAPIRFSIDEHVPEGVSPVKYLAKRLTEELKRHSSAVELDWEAEEKTEEEEMTVGSSFESVF